jgi:signal transduction histidine kinase
MFDNLKSVYLILLTYLPRYYTHKICLGLAVLFFGLNKPVQSQNIKTIDSLKSRLATTTKVEEKFTSLNELFKQYNQIDYEVALTYATDFFNLAKQVGDSTRIVEGGRKIAYSLMDLGRNDEATKTLVFVLGVAERNKEELPEIKKQIKFILNNAGIAYNDLGNYDKALNYHFRSLLIREEEGDKKSIGTALNNLGIVFYNLEDYKEAIKYYLRALQTKKELGDNTDLDRILINLGLCYNQIGEFKDAIDQFHQGFEACGTTCSDNVKREGLLGLGIAYLGSKNLSKAEDCLLSSLKISKEQNNILYQINNLYRLSLLESSRGLDQKALQYLDEALLLAEGSGFVEPLIQIYDQFAEVYGRERNYEKTAYYLEKYKKIKDSIYSKDLIKNLAKVQTNYAERENIKAIKEKDEILELRQQLIDRQFTQILFVVAVTLLSLGLVLVLLITNRKQKQTSAIIAMARNKIADQNRQLEEQNLALDQKVRERTVELSEANRQLIDVNTELDNFLYKSSHDLRGPLATLQGLINLAQIEPKDELHFVALLSNLNSHTEKMSKMLSRLSLISDLSQSLLKPEKIDLESTLARLVESEKKSYQSSNIELTFKINGQIALVSDQLLFETIVENLVTNGIKFCKNTERIQPFVHIELSQEGVMVCIRVSDNGIGITNKPAAEVFRLFMRGSDRSETGGVGLYLSKVCVDRLGGEIQLEKSSGEGSTFLVQLPTDLTPILTERRRLQDVVRRKEREALDELRKMPSAD